MIDGKLRLTTNNGESWSEISPAPSVHYDYYSLAVSGNNVFAGTNGKIWLLTVELDRCQFRPPCRFYRDLTRSKQE